MNDKEIDKLVHKKLFLIDCFLFSSTHSSGSGAGATLRHGVTHYYLGSVILELIVKILHELEFKKQALFNHNIYKIYQDLKSITRSYIEHQYDEARERARKKIEHVDDTVTFPPFTQLLSDNENFIKNFKYDGMASKSNSAVDGIFYKNVFEFIANKRAKLYRT